MAIPGVVGVYVGLMDDGKTLCLKVMVSEKTRELDQQIPKSLEGYPVVIEKTGLIRPLSEKKIAATLIRLSWLHAQSLRLHFLSMPPPGF